MAAKEPCPHPERGGHHEWYLTTTPKYGGIILCRACGKVKIRPGDTGCAVCGGPIERDRKNFDVCASCDDSEPCDHSGGELTADRATGEETCGDCGRQPMAAKEPTVEREHEQAAEAYFQEHAFEAKRGAHVYLARLLATREQAAYQRGLASRDERCLQSDMQRIRERLAAEIQPAESQWVAVSERLPEKRYFVLVNAPSLGIEYAYLEEGSHGELVWYWSVQGYGTMSEVTHWMPLPAPPEPTNGR